MGLIKAQWQLILIVAAVFLLWNTPVMIPLKILIVFFHEVSHGAAAVLTGGEIESISVSPRQGGVTVTRGGNLFVITTAGYLGSLVMGVVLFLMALKSGADRVVMAILGGVVLLVAALYVRQVFAIGFCVLTGAGMLAMARYLPMAVNDTALRVIGLTSMIYVPFDIVSDTIIRSNLRSDAYNLAAQVGGAAWLWGGLWLMISLYVIWQTLKRGLSNPF